MRKVIAGILLGLMMAGCATSPPKNLDNICSIFEEKPDWYGDARDSYRKWKIPIPVMMAVIYQESRFVADARPPRTKLLGFIPWSRPSTSYGYTQALESTWEVYVRSTGNSGADRDDFEDAVDFIGWYCDRSHRKCNISRKDAYHLYLAYHEGPDGFTDRTYREKSWLLEVARKVKWRASLYNAQLARCRGKLERKKEEKWFWFF
ncbi:MAG: transglycosylase SLT domain-containing protein [Candidatus Euphemobacter frigidus]|nr:transglycosylase SLT domain-containing protein [Candidatus Euphemobacter frigidus]MDP8275993.1 transglycosylase SLT domain-containing protein [Candidatus Euphemobacter frigidus]